MALFKKKLLDQHLFTLTRRAVACDQCYCMAAEGTTDCANEMEESSSREGPSQNLPETVEAVEGPDQNGHSKEPAEEEKEHGEGGKRRKCRRKHKGGRHRKGYKPYYKMTWEEKRSLEERETKRAFKKREQQFAAGQPMAPFNTTQFLMDQHDSMDASQLEENPAGHQSRNSGEGSFDSSDEFCDSNPEEEAFLERDFTQAYETYQAERLQSMGKGELIREHLEMEAKLEALQKTGKEQKNNNESELEAEIRRLREENVWLRRENGILKGIRSGGESTEC